MSDLIERLRKKRAWKGMYDDESADRIEHLESALRRLGDEKPFPPLRPGPPLDVYMWQIDNRIEYANQALEDKPV